MWLAFRNQSQGSAGVFHPLTLWMKDQGPVRENTWGLLQNKCREDPASPEGESVVLHHSCCICDPSCHPGSPWSLTILMKIVSSKKPYFGPGHSVDVDDSGAAVSKRPTVAKVGTDVGLSDQIAKSSLVLEQQKHLARYRQKFMAHTHWWLLPGPDMVQAAWSGLGSQAVTGISWKQAGAAGHWDAEGSSYELLAPSPGCISTVGSLSRWGNSPTELERVQILKPYHLSLNCVSYWLGDLRQLLKSVSYSRASISIMDIMKTGWQWNYPQGW